MKAREQWNLGRQGFEAREQRNAEAVMRDRRYDRLRTASARRLLVVVVAVGIVAVGAVTVLVGMLPAQPVIVVTVAAFLLLRVSVRAVADLPEQYLDERQLALRYRVYQDAYRWLGLVAMALAGAGVITYIALSKDPGSAVVTLDDTHLLALFYVTAALVIALPTMVLALRDADRP